MNRFEFIRVANKYNLTVLKSKEEFKKHDLQHKLLKDYFFIEGIQINGLTDFTVTTKENLEKLPKTQIRELYSAGLKLKLVISIISLILLFILNNDDAAFIIFFTLFFVWGNTLRSLFRDESDIRHLINSFAE